VSGVKLKRCEQRVNGCRVGAGFISQRNRQTGSANYRRRRISEARRGRSGRDVDFAFANHRPPGDGWWGGVQVVSLDDEIC